MARVLEKLVLRATILGLLTASILKPVSAEPPQEVVRTFAVALNPGTDPLPDFLDASSLAVVVTQPEKNPDSFRFSSSNSDPSFDSTVWTIQPALHIAVGGAEIPGSVSWLVTPETPSPPPAGAITFTGAESPQILSQELVYVQSCTAASCEDYSPTIPTLRVSSPTTANSVLVVVTAVFSR